MARKRAKSWAMSVYFKGIGRIHPPPSLRILVQLRERGLGGGGDCLIFDFLLIACSIQCGLMFGFNW